MANEGKLIFKTFIPETLDTLQKIKPTEFKWFAKAVDDFKKHQEGTHILKCPGVNTIIKTGWIQKNYQDIEIRTNGDGKTFECLMTYDQINHKYGKLMSNYISDHPPEMFDKFRPMNNNTLKTFIKFQTPWIAYIPDGYKLLQIPVSYSDENIFTAATGFLKGACHLNVPVYWHQLEGRHIIKKGTPICQYLLIKDNDVETEIACANDDDYNIFLND